MMGLARRSVAVAAAIGMAACGAAVAAAQVPAAPAAPLTATGKWVVNYDKDMCVLERRYGTGDQAVSLGFRPIPMAQQVEVVLVRPSKPGPLYRFGNGTLILDGKPVAAPFESYYLPNHQRVATYRLDDGVEAVIAAHRVTIAGDGPGPVTLEPGASPGVQKAIATCQDDLLATWGVDVPAMKRWTTPPVPVTEIGKLIGPDDYPAAAVHAGESGRAVALMTVGMQGAVTGCRVTVSATPVLDLATCALLTRRVHFMPATGPDGEPVVGAAVVAIKWQLPT